MRAFLVERFRRITASSAFMPEIDGLRFLAIAWVVLFHINIFILGKAQAGLSALAERYELLSLFLGNGSRGVELFFVISGFILALPFAKRFIAGERVFNLKAYFLRRLTRLEPPYIFNMIVAFIALIAIGRYAFNDIFTSLLSSLVYLHNILPVGPGVNGVAWSLEIEVQFYILAPLLACVFFLKRPLRIVCIILSIGALLLAQHFYLPAFLSLYNYLQYFLIGFLLVDMYVMKTTLSLSRPASFMLGLGLFGVIFFVDMSTVMGDVLFLASVYLLYLLALTNDVWKRVFGTTWVTLIGGMCYSIYLWHYIVISFVGGKTIAWATDGYLSTLLTQGLLLCGSVLAVSSFFYLLIERPCMDKEWPMKLRERIRGLLH